MTKAETYEPNGLRFHDIASGREMILVADGQPFAGWICYRHPDGQWVSLRKATDDDRAKLLVATTEAEQAGFVEKP